MKKILAFCACFSYAVSMPALAFQSGSIQEKSICHGSLHAQKLAFPVAGDFVVPDTVSESLFDELSSPIAGEINALSPSSDEKPRYLAIGGSLTAGVRNGGLYRFAQRTSYSSLIARQMALKDFAQPLFRREEANGSGYLKLLRTEPFPIFQEVAGTSAIVQSEPLTYNAYSGRGDNLGMPFTGIFAFGDRQVWRYNCDFIPSIPYDFQYRHFFRRYLSNDGNAQWETSVLDYALSQKSDLCTIELGIDDFIVYATTGGYQTSSLPFAAINEEGNPLIQLLIGSKNTRTKVVLATVPDIINFPYFHFVTPSMARQRNGGAALYAMINDDLFDKSKGSAQFLTEVKDTDLLLPTQNVEALFSGSESKRGISPQRPLESKDVLTEDELGVFDLNNSLNDLIRNLASKFEYPVVDLHGIYKRILDGQFVTDDGVRIDASYPNGNFFSDDGLHPTALGQAVIANEWIKVINKHYGARIPLLTISEFSKFQRN